MSVLHICCCVCRSILFQVLAALYGLNSTGIELAPSRWKTSCRALQKMDSLGIRQESRTENSKVFVNCLPSGCFPYIHLKVVDLSWILGRIPIEPKLVAKIAESWHPPAKAKASYHLDDHSSCWVELLMAILEPSRSFPGRCQDLSATVLQMSTSRMPT